MKEKDVIPSTADAAGWMALPIGAMWSAAFLCTMYGMGSSALSMLGTVLALLSIYMLYKQLTNYRRLYASVSWLHIFRLSLVTCLLAGLLTDAVQYVYFLLFDGGRMLSLLSTTMSSEEYRETLQKIMPEQNLDEMQSLLQGMTIRDIMLQMVFYNIMLALPVSLAAALPVRSSKKQDNQIIGK